MLAISLILRTLIIADRKVIYHISERRDNRTFSSSDLFDFSTILICFLLRLLIGPDNSIHASLRG